MHSVGHLSLSLSLWMRYEVERERERWEGWAEVRVIGLVHLHVPRTAIFLCHFLLFSFSFVCVALLFQSKCPAAGTQQPYGDKDALFSLRPFAFFFLLLYLFIYYL